MIRFITSILSLLYVLLVGTPTPKYDLRKKQSKGVMIETWLLNHANIILPLCFIVLMFLFVALAFALVGVSATDSGLQYNHLGDMI